MKYRNIPRLNVDVSEIGFGAWAIGGSWGEVSDETSLEALQTAVDNGVTFIDTADAYGDGRSERLVAKVKKPEIFIATKAGRRFSAEGPYTEENLRTFVARSIENLGSIDLLQLHCPPNHIYYSPETFAILDKLVEEKKISGYGVSVEKVEEALKAIEYPNLKSVQIIFNMFRQRPCEKLLNACKEKGVGVIVRVPLASGLLSGKITKDSIFPADDHRNYNKNGERFDVGETFSGVNFEKALLAVEELKKICPENMTLAQFALKWILMFPVSTIIVGAKTKEQVLENTKASDFPNLSDEVMQKVKMIYEKYIKEDVHQRW